MKFPTVLVALTLVACAGPDHRRDGRVIGDRKSAAPTEKITVCHKGKKTLVVAASALQAHLGHGDHRGACR